MRNSPATILRVATAAICVVAASGSAATAQELDQQKIVACMMEHTSDEQRKLMSDMIVAALQQNDAEVRKGIVLVGSMISGLALNQCKMSFQYLQQPEFQKIAHDYGTRLGEQIMQQAFARLK